MIWVEVQSRDQPQLVSKSMPLKTTMDIPIIIACITRIWHLKSKLWVVTSYMQTYMQLDLSLEKPLDFQSRLLKLMSRFGQIWEKLECGKLALSYKWLE